MHLKHGKTSIWFCYRFIFSLICTFFLIFSFSFLIRYCPQCKDHIEATKKFDLWNLPRILVIHLKRFHYNRFRRDKIDTTVNFPLRGLQLRDYIVDPTYDKSTVYDLIGVCNHYGNLAGGHCKYQVLCFSLMKTLRFAMYKLLFLVFRHCLRAQQGRKCMVSV